MVVTVSLAARSVVVSTAWKEARRNVAAFPNHLERCQVLAFMVLSVVTGTKSEALVTRPDQLSKEQVLRWASRREQVGGRIRELRLEQGLSQEALALEAGLSRNMIIGIEWGRKSLAYERLWDIAAVLGCDVAEFLVSAGRPPSTSPYRGGRRTMQSSDERRGE